MITEIKKDVLATDEFIVTDSSNNTVTGLVNSDFTRDLYNPSGSEVSSFIVPTITELGDGKYRVTFTPNANGNWVLTIYNATYFPAGKDANYRCIDYRVEDTDTILSGTHGSGSWEGSTPANVAAAVWDAKSADYVKVGSMGRLMKNSGASSFVQRVNNLKGVWTRDEKGILLKDLKMIIERLVSIETYMPKVHESQIEVDNNLSTLETNLNNSIETLKVNILDSENYSQQDLEEERNLHLTELELLKTQLAEMKSQLKIHNVLVKDAITAEFKSINKQTANNIKQSLSTIEDNINKLNEANIIKEKEDEIRDKLLVKMLPFEMLENLADGEKNEHTEINE